MIFDVFKTLLVLKPNLKEVTEAISPFAFVFRFSIVENLNRNWKILWQGISHEVQFYTTNIGANINFDNIFSLTIVGNTTCTIPGVLLKKLAINQELIIGHDNAVRSDAVFFFKKISNTFGIFGTRGVAEDIHLHGYNTLIIEY